VLRTPKRERWDFDELSRVAQDTLHFGDVWLTRFAVLSTATGPAGKPAEKKSIRTQQKDGTQQAGRSKDFSSFL